MAQGIAIGGQTAGGSAVGPTNPLPVYTPSGYGFQITDGTYVADVVSGGTKKAGWNEGLIAFGKDTAGTFFPIPLDASGTAVPISIVNPLPTGTNTIGSVVPKLPVATASAPFILTTTAGSAVLAAAGAGSANYILGIQVSNTSGTFARIDLATDGTMRKSMGLAKEGGGFVSNYPHPGYKLPGTFGLDATLSAAVTDVRVSIDYYVAP